jgi:hypothetical protein
MAKGIIVHGTISIFIFVVFFLLLMYIDITSRLGVCSRTLPTMTTVPQLLMGPCSPRRVRRVNERNPKKNLLSRFPWCRCRCLASKNLSINILNLSNSASLEWALQKLNVDGGTPGDLCRDRSDSGGTVPQ